MNLNHDVQSSPKNENYMNGSIEDFTDCIDFTKQYQKSCGFGDVNFDVINDSNDANNPINKINDIVSSGKSADINHGLNENVGLKSCEEKSLTEISENCNESIKHNKCSENNVTESDHHPMEPDVSITVGESNIEKSVKHVAKVLKIDNDKLLNTKPSENFKKKVNKQKLAKKNHLKLPVNKNIKKKVSLFKFRNGKHVKKKNESFQYQGIQSNIKFKCYKCSYSDFSTISELQTHQRKCISGTPDFQSFNDSSSLTNPSTSNIRITRKVYLCSACGSYYENWNLFLHMKEMHKRHICLYCLGMFSQPDKLAQHLQAKHNVIEQNLSSSDEFLKLYRGTCYLICVTCEAMFSEQEYFYEHSCISSQAEDSAPCPLCGMQGTHFPNCRRAFSDRYLESDYEKSHPALAKKLSVKKKKVKGNKKSSEMFQIVTNEHNRDISVTVKKQNSNDNAEIGMDTKIRDNLGHRHSMDKSVMSPLRNSNEDLVSTKQYNEKMLQLYRPSKTSEKVISSLQSIEESINRVVENSRMEEDVEKGYENDDGDDESEVRGQIGIGFEKTNNQTSGDPSAEINQRSESLLKVDENVTGTAEEQTRLFSNSQENESIAGKSSLKTVENTALSDSESTDSEKLTIAFDQPMEQVEDKAGNAQDETDSAAIKQDDNIPTAPKDTSYIHVSVNEDHDEVKALIRECVKVSCWNCVYCSHAKRIALNGKQLALHILAEHRFVTVSQDASDEDKEESALEIIRRLKNSLPSLNNCYFNTDTFDSENKDFWKANDRIYECFHCLFATYIHKELCSHNRKMHQKAVFLCIMCKSNFYTYSELLCHLCPGIYISGQVINPDITYRCFLCNVDPLPSSFRLMVHLRRNHNSCDICFDQSNNQFQLSTHVWKHKLSHMCYRCGIAYRNKPDITKHLFWKHGTESVLCKKCLQKKWPHVYHFCVPPNSFICDECSVSLKTAVALKVHKRIHSGDYLYPCNKCEEKFISRKLLGKHLSKHEEETNKPVQPELTEVEPEKNTVEVEEVKNVEGDHSIGDEGEKKPEKEKRLKKKKILTDVFDLPPVNLSESDDSDSDEMESKMLKSESPTEEGVLANGFPNGDSQKEEPSQTQIVDGVWNNFQNYLVAKDMPKTFRPASPFKNMTLSRIKEIMLSDHDYHLVPGWKADAEKSSENSKKVGLDHDYCNNVQKTKASCRSKQKTKHKEDASKSSSSDSSSDSDSSCSCGSNCSCSSGSSSSTSSNESDSDSREKRRQKKSSKDAKATNEVEPEPPTEVDVSVHDIPSENLIRESDLDTEETETDEDFYDFNPAREANRILAEKRTQLLANLNGSDAVTSSPSVGAEKPASPKKKTKFKRKRSQGRGATAGNRRKSAAASVSSSAASATVTTLNKNRTAHFVPENSAAESASDALYDTPTSQTFNQIRGEDSIPSSGEGGDSKRPKRKRVPLKFYGFSSDDENEATPTSKKREKGESNSAIAPAVATNLAPYADNYVDRTPSMWNPNSKTSLSWRIENLETSTPKVNPIKIRTSQSSRQTPVVETVGETDSFQIRRPVRNFQVNGNPPAAQKGEKLYCFCQCPYDEVSEMIACDAEDCVIEWFHFECVGIMVPPKGSWYCPDCRKKLAAENEFLSPLANEQNVN